MKKILTLILFIGIVIQSAHAQEIDLKKVPGQFSMLYPLGTLGQNAGDYEVGMSINALVGKTGAINGLEIGGLVNRNLYYVHGTQIAGIANLNQGELQGVQIGGISNYAESVEGFQIAGIINRTQKLNGLQVGLINVVDTLESGFSVGLINIYKYDRYTEWEISHADYAQMRLSFKYGHKSFYTIFSLGANTYQHQQFIYAFGFGHLRSLNEKWALQPELISLNYLDDEYRLSHLGTATHFKIGLVRNISQRWAISLAPSIYWAHALPFSESNMKVSPIQPWVDTEIFSNPFQLGYGLSLAIQLR